jgi:hypothetical protein
MHQVFASIIYWIHDRILGGDMRARVLAAATLTLAIAGGAAHAQEQEEGGLDVVRRELIGILQENGWKDARIDQLSGSEELFEIRGLKASRKGADGRPESVDIGTLTVEGIQPEDRWTRAESIRADGVKVVLAGNAIDIGVIYAKKPGVLDIDIGRPSAAFDNVILSKASWSRDGQPLANLDEVYVSAGRWIGTYGVPGRMDLTAKGQISPALPILAMLGVAPGSAMVSGEFGLKTSVSSSRDELNAAASFASGRTSWAASAVLTEFDTALFRAWFDRDNPEEDRSPEVSKSYAEAFDREVAQIGLKSFEVRGKSDASLGGPVASAISAGLTAWLPAAAGPAAAPALLDAVKALSGSPKSFGLSALARDAVPVADILAAKGEPLAKFLYKITP